MKPEEARPLVQRWIAQWLARSKRQSGQAFALIFLRMTEPDTTRAMETILPILRVEDTAVAVEPGNLAVLVADLRHLSDPLRIVQRLQQALLEELVGAGVALSVSGPESAQAMWTQAQQAVDSAASGSCVYWDTPRQREAEERLALESSLRKALQEGLIKPHYQPIVELKSGQITGFEALARWHHPEQGCLLPKSFLSVASDCGLLSELDLSILDQSLEQLARWSQQAEQPIRLSVNLCSDHFLLPGGVQRLRPILDAHRAVINHLRVDISEQVLFEQAGVDALKELRDLKVGFHLDDFGVGPESFHCLASFPFHSLKIDRSLIAEMEEEVNAELIAALLRIAGRMKMRTLAEGLVTHAQLEELRLLGCHEAQGFLFSPAVTAEEALQLLQEGQCW